MTEPSRIDAKVERLNETFRTYQPPTAMPRLSDADLFDDDLAEIRAERDRGLVEVRASVWRRLIPQRFHDASIDQFAGQVHDDLAEWAANPDGRNLLLLGPVGTGKTHAAIGACRPAHDRGLDVRYFPTGRLLDVLRPGGPEETEIDDVIAVDRLILDDIGVERRTEWAAERLDLIIDGRWAAGAPTIVTTNLEPKHLAERLGERTYSRLVGGALPLRLAGTDRRRT